MENFGKQYDGWKADELGDVDAKKIQDDETGQWYFLNIFVFVGWKT